MIRDKVMERNTKGIQYSDYNSYLFRPLRKNLQLRIGYYIWSNILEYSADNTEQMTVISDI